MAALTKRLFVVSALAVAAAGLTGCQTPKDTGGGGPKPRGPEKGWYTDRWGNRLRTRSEGWGVGYDGQPKRLWYVDSYGWYVDESVAVSGIKGAPPPPPPHLVREGGTGPGGDAGGTGGAAGH